APVAAVISRADWAADLSFVGHRAAIEAVRFNPRVFVRSADPADPAGGPPPAGPPLASPASPSLACVCAAGGQDRGVSVWLTSQHMPIAAATHLFSGNLMDLAWHTPIAGGDDRDDSRVVAYLAACSYDGTVAMLEFTQAELGRPISVADQEALLIKHGWIKRGDDSDPAAAAAAAAESRRPVLAESVEQLRLEERGREILLESAVARDSRIAQIMDGCLKPSTTQSKSEPQATMSDAPVPVLTKSGKKRVAPVFVRPLTGGSHAAQSATTMTTTAIAPTAIADDVLAYNVCSTTTASALPSSSRAPVLVDRVAVDAPIWIEARALGTRTMRAPAEPSTNGQSSDPIASITATVRPLGRQTLIHSQSISAARVHLSVPRIVAHVTCTAMTMTQASLTAYNKHQHQKQQKTVEAKIVCSAKKPGAVVWTKHLTGCAVALLAASDVVAAASCTDGTLHLFDSESGARLLPPIMCEAHLAHLRCVGRFCLALDCVGQLTVWDVDRVCAVVDHVSVAPLLYSAELIDNGQSGAETEEKEKEIDEGDDDDDDDEGETVKAPKRHKPSVALTAADVSPDTGAPIVCLSDGRSFSYHLQLRSWLRIGDPASYAGSDFAPLPPA
ncbi:HIR complex subunit, partial [Coemansia sp. RSA 2052]